MFSLIPTRSRQDAFTSRLSKEQWGDRSPVIESRIKGPELVHSAGRRESPRGVVNCPAVMHDRRTPKRGKSDATRTTRQSASKHR